MIKFTSEPDWVSVDFGFVTFVQIVVPHFYAAVVVARSELVILRRERQALNGISALDVPKRCHRPLPKASRGVAGEREHQRQHSPRA